MRPHGHRETPEEHHAFMATRDFCDATGTAIVADVPFTIDIEQAWDDAATRDQDATESIWFTVRDSTASACEP